MSPVASAPLPENEDLKAFLLAHMDGFEDRLSDTTTHSYEAYLWLANTDTSFDTLDSFHKLQRFGLVAFFISTSPEYDWKVPNNWKSSQHECTWFGISCAVDNTVVTEISLPSNRLAGTIPPEIALAGIGGSLGKLNLAGNNIGGKLPEQIGTLTHLEVLDLAYNDLTGNIPTQLASLSKLKSLELQSNKLTGDMPDEICALRAGVLEKLVADCDPDDPFDKITCETATCCSECS